MTTKASICSLAALALGLLLLLSCNDGSSSEGSSEADLWGLNIVMLPPGHPGTVNGSTLYLPGEATPPVVRAANCFAGVPALTSIGIGSIAGVTANNVGRVTLPVNINLDTAKLGAFRIKVTVSDPATVSIDAANITASNPVLATGACSTRGCPATCGSYPTYYPNQFNRAFGFEHIDTVGSGPGWATVETFDADPANPTTGVANLCNIPIDVIGPIPAGGVALTLQVEMLQNDLGNPIAPNAVYSGVVAENAQLQ